MLETVKCLLEEDQGYRVAVEAMTIVFRQKLPDRERRACASYLVLQKPGVPATLSVIPCCTLLFICWLVARKM
jgi:hypothetical protein